MIVYLAGAIDLVGATEARAWRDQISKELKDIGISTFNPAAAFSYVPSNKATAQKLIDINRSAMFHCDFVIVAMDKNTPSVGTPIELHMLNQSRTPHVVLWNSDGDLPAYVQGLADKVVRTKAAAIDVVLDWEKRRADPDAPQLMNTGSNVIGSTKIVPANRIMAVGTDYYTE